MRALVTGAAGFIGSNLVDRLLQSGWDVIGVDNFSTGRIEFLETALASERFSLLRVDLLHSDDLPAAMPNVDVVFHLAANADVRFGTRHPRRDLEQNTIVTSNVLEAMRAAGVRKIVFSSSASVYGEAAVIPTPENAPFPVQTSLYGASKLAAEGLIASYCEGFGMQSWILRFVSCLGERYTHGHVFDFVRRLLDEPRRLTVLGDGTQRKSYIYVQDCIDGILTAVHSANQKVNVLNLGTAEHCTVNDSLNWICRHLGVCPEVCYTGGHRGWVGDNPFIFLDCAELRNLGWIPKHTIQDAVIRTIEYLRRNPGMFTRPEDSV